MDRAVELTVRLELKDLYKAFPGFGAVLKGICLNFYSTKLTYILGASGVGKSVLLKHILGLLKPDSGSIFFENKDIVQASEKEWMKVRKNFGILFQNSALFDEMSIFENVAFPLVEFSDFSPVQIQEHVAATLTRLGITQGWDRYPSTLSGGQKKRVALARAIIRKPSILLYDEPTTGLDPLMRAAVDALIGQLKNEHHLTSIVISHDVSSALLLGDYIAFIFEGKIIFFGTPQQFVLDKHVVIQGFLNAEKNRMHAF